MKASTVSMCPDDNACGTDLYYESLSATKALTRYLCTNMNNVPIRRIYSIDPGPNVRSIPTPTPTSFTPVRETASPSPANALSTPTPTSTLTSTSKPTSTPSPSPPNKEPNISGAIAGSVVGGLSLFAIVGGVVFLILRKRRQQEAGYKKGNQNDPDGIPELQYVTRPSMQQEGGGRPGSPGLVAVGWKGKMGREKEGFVKGAVNGTKGVMKKIKEVGRK
ncbi:hypothetical protein B0J11DRAFT_50013 [Dendryphion nanum]|uniref:Uncharacterized protein n=1 Tax=Dendryphion nanum TaxID=256645 RepID=A0A9P9DLL0_9PLEO|nr:hypothetical protein B0J11DRAFT_50013 [Dendryphion nanum]